MPSLINAILEAIIGDPDWILPDGSYVGGAKEEHIISVENWLKQHKMYDTLVREFEREWDRSERYEVALGVFLLFWALKNGWIRNTADGAEASEWDDVKLRRVQRAFSEDHLKTFYIDVFQKPEEGFAVPFYEFLRARSWEDLKRRAEPGKQHTWVEAVGDEERRVSEKAGEQSLELMEYETVSKVGGRAPHWIVPNLGSSSVVFLVGDSRREDHFLILHDWVSRNKPQVLREFYKGRDPDEDPLEELLPYLIDWAESRGWIRCKERGVEGETWSIERYLGVIQEAYFHSSLVGKDFSFDLRDVPSKSFNVPFDQFLEAGCWDDLKRGAYVEAVVKQIEGARRIGFLSPQGEFFPLPSGESHMGYAGILLDEFHPGQKGDLAEAVGDLENFGWVRAVDGGFDVAYDQFDRVVGNIKDYVSRVRRNQYGEVVNIDLFRPRTRGPSFIPFEVPYDEVFELGSLEDLLRYRE